MNLFTIPAGAPFAETLAKGLIARIGTDPLALARAVIYLPTRRAARSFGDAFSRVLGGAALLPSFRPLGDVDEDELLLDGSAESFALPPAISPPRRRLLLATLIRRWHEAKRGEALTFPQATALADGLAGLLDEIETHGADITKLDAVVPSALAEHWSDVRDFLALLHTEWPSILAAEKAMNPAARRDASIKALAERLERTKSDCPIIAAGSTGSIPATANLLGIIARLPQGAVVLPGLDRKLDDEAWSRIDADPGHPQFGMRQLLARIGARREDVTDWMEAGTGNDARELLLREVLRPAPTTDAWRVLAEGNTGAIAQGLEGLSLIEAADPAEEASAIALVLREVLETEGQTGALVTPDRALARRVTAELARFDIAIDDSAGRPLTNTPAGSFLCLLAEAADEEFAPVPLIALLKHPLTAHGEKRGAFLRRVRQLDVALRGPRPNPWLDGILRYLAQPGRDAELLAWFERVAQTLRPFERLLKKDDAELREFLDAHVAAAESLATAPDGEIALWRGEAGEAAATMIAALLDAAADIPAIEPGAYASFFRAASDEKTVRPLYNRHPRLAILGPLEARLQRFDVSVLGGLNEGTWPRAAVADPWLSRPMRKAIGLDPPERAIGLSAHDFATLSASGCVILTRAQKAEGAPTIASRWLQRLIQLTRGLKFDGHLAASNCYLDIARALAHAGEPQRIRRPAPTPPFAARPRKLSVTEIETWLRDPYAIYARRVLKLDPLDPLDAEIGPLERGTALHTAMELFLARYPGELPPDAALRLMGIADEVFRELAVPQAALAIWRPRFFVAAELIVREERERRHEIAHSIAETKGELRLGKGAKEFLLHGRADRVDILKNGEGRIIDYKSGEPPSDKQVRQLLSPQLPLEAAMLKAGGFEGVPAAKPAGLVYVRLGGNAAKDAFHTVNVDAGGIAAEAIEKLATRIAFYDDEATPYYPRVLPIRSDIVGDYDHLARVREWSLGGNGEDGE